MEFVPPETFLSVAASIMPNLRRGSSANRRNRRFRSCFGTTPDTCADLWFLCYNHFRPTTRPVHLLWALMFMKNYDTEENNASRAGVHEDTFRDWVWHIIRIISNVNYVIIFLRNYLINVFSD